MYNVLGHRCNGRHKTCTRNKNTIVRFTMRIDVKQKEGQIKNRQSRNAANTGHKTQN
jgi:DNA topoisomerase VI subunit B